VGMAATLARSHRSKAREPDGGALLKVGDLLAGKYRVERILGEGGMGVVVAAHHELLDQHVAVKLLYQDIADREAQSRLLLEARACAKLQSEHVARVVDVDTGADGLPFIVMELLEGADLCQIADARGALPRWLVVDYVLQALEGLAHAHSRGIVHRDLKPSNLFLANRPDGTQIIKILDFGISKSTEPGDSGGARKKQMQLTGGRAVLGSPPYMSPEQVRSPKTVDARTDIWSLGIVMYELLTNSMPFGGDEMNETFAQILEKEPQPIRQIVHGVPEGLERIVMRCLAKNRDERFADVAELARALVVYGSGTWMQSADRDDVAHPGRGGERSAPEGHVAVDRAQRDPVVARAPSRLDAAGADGHGEHGAGTLQRARLAHEEPARAERCHQRRGDHRVRRHGVPAVARAARRRPAGGERGARRGDAGARRDRRRRDGSGDGGRAHGRRREREPARGRAERRGDPAGHRARSVSRAAAARAAGRRDERAAQGPARGAARARTGHRTPEALERSRSAPRRPAAQPRRKVTRSVTE
jgi:Protein kinase domain